MELRDVTQIQMPAPAGRPPEDAAAPEPRRGAIRQPSARAYWAAAVLSAFWIGAAFSFAFGFLGVEGVLALPWPWLAGLIVAVAFPVVFAWMVATLARRSEALQLAVEDVTAIAARLTLPEEAAAREVARVGRAVRRELDAMNAGLETALGRVRALESSIADRLAAAQETARSLQDGGDAIRGALREERDRLAEFAAALDAEAQRIGEGVRARAQALSQIATATAREALAAQGQLDERLSDMRAALERSGRAAGEMLDAARREGAGLAAAADALEQRFAQALQRQDRQRAALGDAASTLNADLAAIEEALARRAEALSGLAAAIAEQTKRTDAATAEAAKRAESVAGSLGARAEAIATALLSETGKLSDAAAAAEDGMRRAVRGAGEAAEALRAAFELAQADSSKAADHARHAAGALKVEADGVIEAVAAKAAEAQDALSAALGRWRTEIETLTAQAAEQAEKLRPPAPPEPPAAPDKSETATADASPTPADPSAEPQGAKSPWFGFGRRLSTFARREPASPANWRLSAALAAADQGAAPVPSPARPREPVDLHREALHVVEKLQALAIDMDRALGDDAPPDLWRRYLAGERGVYARRLSTLIGREGADKIPRRYAEDADFRLHADRYMAEFEGLLDEASARDRDQILVETFLTSQVGKLYLLLAAATGRL